jgi:hypothetical protein
MEGQDVQDVDNLVKYAKREIGALPETIQDKVIGEVKASQQYDRRALQSLRASLESIDGEAREVETEKLDQTLRNTTLYVVVYEILLLLIGFFLSQAAVNQIETLAVLVLLVLGLALLGLAFIPLRGRMVESAYSKRMLGLQKRYIDTINEAASEQLEYGMQLRREAISPLTRLIEAQTTIQRGQLVKLENAQTELASIESELTSLGKRRLLGL